MLFDLLVVEAFDLFGFVGDDGCVDAFRCEVVAEDFFEDVEGELECFICGHVLAVFFFEEVFAFALSFADDFGFVLVVDTGRVCFEQPDTCFVDAGDEEANAEWSHTPILRGHLFDIAELFGGDECVHRLVVVNLVLLCHFSGLVDEASGVAEDAGAGDHHVLVDFEDFLDCFWDDEVVDESFVACEDDAVFSGYADSCVSELDCFLCVFDLEEASVRAEHGDSAVVAHHLMLLWFHNVVN